MRQRQWWKFGLYLAGWTLAAFVFAILMKGAEPTLGWRRVITSALGDWYAWGALFPGIFWLASRFPL
jgi:hypothetical protein